MAEERERYAEWMAGREEHAEEEERAREEGRNVELLKGRIRREEMKLALFRFLYDQQ